MAAIDDIMAWEWPQDRNAQGGAMLQFLGLLDALTAEWREQIHPVIQINQATPPTEADWKRLWVAEGNALPIPDGAKLLWLHSGLMKFGGMYTVVGGNIVRAESGYYPGKVDLVPFNIVDTSDVSLNPASTLIDLNNAITLSLKRKAKLLFRLTTMVSEGNIGSNVTSYVKFCYRINGNHYITNAGDTEPGLWSQDFITGTGDYESFSHFEWLHPEELAPGEYTIDFVGLATPSSVAARSFGFAARLLPYNLPDTANSYSKHIPPTLTWEVIYT